VRRLALVIAISSCVAAAVVPAHAQPTAGCYSTTARRSPLRADVDGDGRADRVSVTARRVSDSGCRFTLAVAGAGGWSTTHQILPSKNPYQIGFSPRLLVLAKIDTVRGAEIVIERDEASDTSFALVLTIRHRRVLTLPAPQNPFNTGGVFTYYNGNGAGGGEMQVECGKPGTVITAGYRWLSTNDPYTPDPRYYAERRTYRVTGTRFRQVAATVIPNADRGQAEGVLATPGAIQPFGKCAVTPFN
jgi:hypothetical protein